MSGRRSVVLAMALVLGAAGACGSTPSAPVAQDTDRFVPTSISFPDSRHGWAYGELCLPGQPCRTELWRTGDGGDSWSRLRLPDDRWHPSVVFADERHGWLLGDVLLATGDGGGSWVEEAHAGRVSHVVTAGGRAWALESPSCPSTPCPQAARVLSGLVGAPLRPLDSQPPGATRAVDSVAVGPDGAYLVAGTLGVPGSFTVLVTEDAGVTWQERGPMCRGDVAGVALSPSGHLWATCSMFGMLTNQAESRDGGLTWAPANLTGRWGSGPFAVDGETILFDRGDGRGLRLSDDGGATSRQVFSAGEEGRGIRLVNAFERADAYHVWLIARSVEPLRTQSLLRSRDGGESWDLVHVR